MRRASIGRPPHLVQLKQEHSCEGFRAEHALLDLHMRFVVTNTLIVGDIQRSVAFYRDVVGATVLREGEPTLLWLRNIWLTINRGGGPTDDKPEVVASPQRDQNVLSIFLNLRVTDISRYYDLWSSRGANFITEPKVHAAELRCYMRDPDGYLIEVGQTTMTAGPLDLYS
jgi:catechol 2,3-dioxygenase-like lactoylglutathione lyase family enzyme